MLNYRGCIAVIIDRSDYTVPKYAEVLKPDVNPVLTPTKLKVDGSCACCYIRHFIPMLKLDLPYL